MEMEARAPRLRGIGDPFYYKAEGRLFWGIRSCAMGDIGILTGITMALSTRMRAA